MNPADQHTHRTKTAELGNRLDNLETVVDELGRYTADVSKWAPAVTKRLDLHSTALEALTASNAHVPVLIEEKRSAILVEVGAAIAELRMRNLLGRLRWLVTGR